MKMDVCLTQGFRLIANAWETRPLSTDRDNKLFWFQNSMSKSNEQAQMFRYTQRVGGLAFAIVKKDSHYELLVLWQYSTISLFINVSNMSKMATLVVSGWLLASTTKFCAFFYVHNSLRKHTPWEVEYEPTKLSKIYYICWEW
jgi:hypothetical protein